MTKPAKNTNDAIEVYGSEVGCRVCRPTKLKVVPARSIQLFLLAVLVCGCAFACSSPGSDELAAAREALGQGLYREAIGHYTEVTIQAPGSPEAAQALYDLALIHYLQRRDLESARSTLRRLLSLYPDAEVTRDARRVLARMYEQDLGQPEKAIQEYELLLVTETNMAKKKNLLLKIANSRYSTDELELAAQVYGRVIQEFTYGEGSATAHLRLAHIDRLKGRAEKSIETLEKLLARAEEPDTRRRGHLMQAEAFGDLQRYEDAETLLGLAEEEFPGDPEIADMVSSLEQQEEAQRSVEANGELEKQFNWGRGRTPQP